jgi:hypothetical protein
MPTSQHIERGILVFTIWACLGFLGLGVVLEGLARDSWPLSACGVGVIVLAFVAHIIVNGVCDTGFTQGEALLGIGTYGFLGLVFIASALFGDISMPDLYSGLTLFGMLAAGFLAYIATRHGLRGAFSRFHMKGDDMSFGAGRRP